MLFLLNYKPYQSSLFAGEKPANGPDVRSEGPSLQNNLPADGAEWVELLVREMMSATSIDDARTRSTRVLESLEKSICAGSAEAAQNFQKVGVVFMYIVVR